DNSADIAAHGRQCKVVAWPQAVYDGYRSEQQAPSRKVRNTGGKTKLAAILHGFLLLGSVALLPMYLNMIPLSALAAILIVTGMRLASPALFREMWRGGRYQFVPFLITLLAIVFSDLLIGILIGLAVSAAFILNSNLRNPVRMISEKHLGGEVLRVTLPNQVSFLNRASIEKALKQAPKGTHLLLDGSNTDYIDPDVLGIFHQFRDKTAAAHHVAVSFFGFRDKYRLKDDTRYAQHSTQDLQRLLTPEDVLDILKEGNQRFVDGQRLFRNLPQQLADTSQGQFPFACVLSCIDSRAPVETVFDLGLGDIFSIRIAGNVTSGDVLGSMEYACSIAGAKLILVLGHTRCGAVSAAVKMRKAGAESAAAKTCSHLGHFVEKIQEAFVHSAEDLAGADESLIQEITKRNVLHSVSQVLKQSTAIREAVEAGRIAVMGGMYDVATGRVEFYAHEARGLRPEFADHFVGVEASK
ncbi:MAG: SulP family inorganic anion transporter, partial [bacterium]|nr:SulP family inorganic anion transporter [bacterium]